MRQLMGNFANDLKPKLGDDNKGYLYWYMI